MLETADPSLLGVATHAPGPAGLLPLTAEMLLTQPSGNLFGLTQNAGMGWNPESLLDPEFLILSTHGGLRAENGEPIALGFHTGHWEVGLLVAEAARELKALHAIPFAGACTDPCDGRTQGTAGMLDSLPYRNDAAIVLRRLMRSLPTGKGVIGIATCDKGLPATPSGWSPPTSSQRPPSTCCGPSPRAGSPTSPRSTPGTRQFVASSTEGRRYERIASEIDRAMRFMAACGIDLAAEDGLHQVDFWTSHEALILNYEEALTRRDSLTGDWVDCSAHILWVGERTRQLDGAHLEFLVRRHQPGRRQDGPTATPDEVVALCDRLEPDRHAGAAAPSSPGSGPAGWRCCCRRSSRRWATRGTRWSGPATRCTATPSPARAGARPGASTTSWPSSREFFAVHRAAGTWPGGVHVELTGDDVTECLGGAEEILEDQLDQRYTTACDPRLNARQSLDLAFRVAELHRLTAGLRSRPRIPARVFPGPDAGL